MNELLSFPGYSQALQVEMEREIEYLIRQNAIEFTENFHEAHIDQHNRNTNHQIFYPITSVA